ncbi:aminotransferase class IV [Thermodesulfovibrio hydrogeniphilus]
MEIVRTLLFGEGIFETILWRGRTKRLKRHYVRLKASAEFLGLPCPDFEDFCSAIEEKVGDRKNLYVKFCLLSKGDLLYYSNPQDYDVIVLEKELAPNFAPKKLCLSSIKRHSKSPVIYHKTMNYLPNILVKREALSNGFDDAVILNENDEITECSASNILIVKQDKLLTPAKECGLLLGTTMQILIEKMGVKEQRLKLKDIYEASAIFITNSLMGATAVSRFMDKEFKIDEDFLKILNSAIDEENL